jgi:hypothetical protein
LSPRFATWNIFLCAIKIVGGDVVGGLDWYATSTSTNILSILLIASQSLTCLKNITKMFFYRNLFLTLVAILSLATYSCASTAFSRKSITPVFAIPRGGGLFGGGKDSNAEDSTPSPDM